MAAEPGDANGFSLARRAWGVVGRLWRIGSRLLSDRLFGLARRLVEEHVRVAKQEAARELQRFVIAFSLMIGSVIFLACAFLMINLTMVMAFHDLLRLNWVLSSLAAAGMDLMVVATLMGIAYWMVQPPYMPKTKEAFDKTMEVFRDPEKA
ncbi:MAG: phage holin family protein [Alphaproteobacteria bacterium]|nr:phage holin family protein [Alphaproteobacteria bacterium]